MKTKLNITQMAKRFTDTELWDKEWFMQLPCNLKCLVKFVRDKSDLSGVWSPNWIIANAYIGEPVNEADLISIDGGKQFKKIANGKILCIGFVEFQYGKLSEKSPVHRKIIQILNTHKIPYQYPINRVQEEEEDKEEEKVKVKEEENAKFLIPQILQNWYLKFPTYTKSKEDDFPAIMRIITFMMQQHGIPNMNAPDAKEKISGTFEAIQDEINKDPFWINKPIKSIANNIQEFYNKIKNPQNGKVKQSNSRQSANKQSTDYLLSSLAADMERIRKEDNRA
jgi:hypothetical protein